MVEIKWISVSVPKELVLEIEEKKPNYMSISEFVRCAINEKLNKTEVVASG